MKFSKWIEKNGGPHGVAAMIGTESPTVKAWLAGKCSPKHETVERLLALGGGYFSYEDILKVTRRDKTPKKKTRN